MTTSVIAPDLTQRPPRSPRLRLGGYVLLPRILDKVRALNAGKSGEYQFGPKRMDRHFFSFTGLDPAAFQVAAAGGLGDGEMLAWVQTNAKHVREPWEIAAWSAYHDTRGPDSDNETLLDFAEAVGAHSKTREDVKTWFDLLDLDDHCTFGGKA
jgi:hypothetical protein